MNKVIFVFIIIIIYRRNAWDAWNEKFYHSLLEGVDLCTDDFVRTKITWMHNNQIFSPMVPRY